MSNTNTKDDQRYVKVTEFLDYQQQTSTRFNDLNNMLKINAENINTITNDVTRMTNQVINITDSIDRMDKTLDSKFDLLTNHVDKRMDMIQEFNAERYTTIQNNVSSSLLDVNLKVDNKLKEYDEPFGKVNTNIDEIKKGISENRKFIITVVGIFITAIAGIVSTIITVFGN